MNRVKRTQYAIGQGGFHVCEIRTDTGRFRYIYDCGAKNSKILKELIKNWPSNDKSFDWLIISSFDSDHFNCADALLDAGFTFKAVILPHRLDAAMFKYLFFYYILQDLEKEDFVGVVNVFRRMMNGDFGIVLPMAEGAGNPDAQDNEGLISTRDIMADSVNQVSGKSYPVGKMNWMLRFYSVEIGEEEKTLIDKIFSMPRFAELTEIIDNVHASLTQKISEDELSTLMKALDEELKRKIQIEKATLIRRKPAKSTASSVADGKPAQKQSIESTIKESLGSEFKNNKLLIHDYNSASLCLYSGPIPDWFPLRHYHAPGHRIVTDRRISKKLPDFDEGIVGWIGVGDITFKNSSSVRRFNLHYAQELMLTGTRMLPHHGSQSNYDLDLEQFRNFAKTIPKNGLWVAAADPLRGGYRHPDGAIVAESILHGKFHLVSADPVTTLQEVICME